MDKRKEPLIHVETQVLTQSQRRCCLCYFLEDDKREKRGQIAHLNQDRSDSRFENLVWLCLEHHDAYDSKTSQSKGYTKAEVRKYREHLYNVLSSTPMHRETITKEFTKDCWSKDNRITIKHDLGYKPDVVITDPTTNKVVEYTTICDDKEVIINGNVRMPINVQIR